MSRTPPGLVSRLARALSSVARRAADLFPGVSLGSGWSSPVLSGVVVTPQTALTLAAFYCGVNVISTDIAKLPLTLYKRTRNGGRKPLPRDPRSRLFRIRPNAEMNAFRYRQSQMGHALAWGGHYSEIILGGDGMPSALWPLHPGNTKPMRTKDGRLYYEDVNTGKKFLPEKVLHIAGLSFDGINGYSPANQGRQAIGLGIAQEQFGASLFGNGARPGGILKTPKRLGPVAANNLRESFERIHAGQGNAHRTAVLEEGMDWVENQISPEAAQFLMSRRFQVIEIARLLNMPPNKLMDYSEAHHANMEESNEDYVSTTIQGWCGAVEAECNSKLLFEDEQDTHFFEHDMRALLRGNLQARATYFETRFRMGSITPNEVRMIEGENPLDDDKADTAYLQAQYVPLDQAGAAMAPKSPTEKPPAEIAPAQKPTPTPEDSKS